ncbi:hypothetical protein KCM76_08630 [Zooshikella marina]|uniref:hypothetical protein n=1 Tax=Zooshikella ganghwensis TaxID=202772 RepID=UPI001BAEE74E|nr:hypothetical protein [Zooshikella ganghwensis]MBU2706047.1 hypothetical protein [Zooshikella ganghwensis]
MFKKLATLSLSTVLGFSSVAVAGNNPFSQYCFADAPSTMSAWQANPLSVTMALEHANIAFIGTVKSTELVKEGYDDSGVFRREQKVQFLVENTLYNNTAFETQMGKKTGDLTLTLKSEFGGDVFKSQYPFEKGKTYIVHANVEQTEAYDKYIATVFPCGPTTSLAEEKSYQHIQILDDIMAGILIVEPPMPH